MVDVGDLRRQARRDLLDRLRHRLGRRPFLHRLRAAAARLLQRPLRGQTDRDAGRRRLLAGDPGLQGRGVLHRADRLARRAQGGPAGEAHQKLRHHVAAHLVPCRRARRPGHGRLGPEGFGRPGGRSLVADRDRLADRRQSGRPGDAADQARLAERADAGLRCSCRRRGGEARAGRDDGFARHQAAAAAWLLADALPPGRAHARELSQ